MKYFLERREINIKYYNVDIIILDIIILNYNSFK
jgi:hypothetical protein